MATALVTGITTLIFNWTMLKYVGEDGVAAITIIMYVLMFVSSLFSGYSYGAAPMISYYYGAQNHFKTEKTDSSQSEDHYRDLRKRCPDLPAYYRTSGICFY